MPRRKKTNQGLHTGQRRGVGRRRSTSQRKTAPPNTEGMLKARRAYEERMKSLAGSGNRGVRKNMAENLLHYEFGNVPFQKAIYGNDYKYGTLKNLNKQVKSQRGKTTDIASKEKALQSQIASADASVKSALQTRLDALTKNKDIVTKNLGATKKSRDKLIDVRNKALEGIYANMHANPKAAERARIALVRKRAGEIAHPERAKLTTGSANATLTTGLNRAAQRVTNPRAQAAIATNMQKQQLKKKKSKKSASLST